MDDEVMTNYQTDQKLWFYFLDNDEYQVFDLNTFEEIESPISEDPFYTVQDLEAIYEDQWRSFQEQPAYRVGQQIHSIHSKDYGTLKDIYETLLLGSIQIRAFRNRRDPYSQEDYFNRIKSWLESTDFYTAPASTRYHEAYPSGLLEHSLKVYSNMCDLHRIKKFNRKVLIDSATICCLCHDWCKIGLYESYKRNVKDEQTGIWNQVDAYRRTSFNHPFGHGASSMFMAQRMFKLTEEEALAIRWHQGHWNVCLSEEDEFQQACETYPLVHLLQFSDQLAITNY